MQFRFGAAVEQRDGDKVGDLRALIYDTSTEEVLSLVVQRGPEDESEVEIPLGAVELTDLDIVYVELTDRQLPQLPEFEEERNLAPPPALENIDKDQVTDPIDIPDVPPVGAATGVESIAFTPILEESVNVSEGSQLIGEHTAVWATDGELGRVRGVFVGDQTRRLERIIVQEGVFFTREADVPADRIASVQSDAIILSIDQTAVEASIAD